MRLALLQACLIILLCLMSHAWGWKEADAPYWEPILLILS